MTLKNMKFKIADEAQSKALQEVLLRQGYSWGSNNIIQHTDMPNLYTYAWGGLFKSSVQDAVGYFERHANEEQDTASFIESHEERISHNNDNMKAAMAKNAPQEKPVKDVFLEDAWNSDSEGFFSTAEPVIEAGSPWIDNTGECPVEDSSLQVDVQYRDGEMDSRGLMATYHNWGFDTGEEGWEITKWRYHNASDYFKAPKTTPKVETTAITKEYGDAVKAAVAKLNSYTSCMSYNASYFGEPSGYLKSAIRELDHIVNADEYGRPVPLKATQKEVPIEQPVKRNKYMREIKPNVWVDVYDLLRAFNVTDGALAHLVKKALAVGQRGHKDATEDYADIVASAVRAQEMHKEWHK